jgi:hypothetical protein
MKISHFDPAADIGSRRPNGTTLGRRSARASAERRYIHLILKDEGPMQAWYGEQIAETTTEARQGVTGHNVRYVLVWSTVGVIVSFVIVYPPFSGDRSLSSD